MLSKNDVLARACPSKLFKRRFSGCGINVKRVSMRKMEMSGREWSVCVGRGDGAY